MALRTIMIFPQLKNIELINQIRHKYDPLADLIRPHITIAFPFESEMSNDELLVILNKRLGEVKRFEIELQGFSKCEDRFGNYIYLNVVKGMGNIIKMHDCLYANEFKPFNLGLEYVPHITVGKVSDVHKLECAYEDVKNVNCRFTSIVEKISVEMIGEDQESIIVFEKDLN